MDNQAAEILREYGPFPEAETVAGVSFDGENVWFASGNRLNCFDPEARRDAAVDRRRRPCRHGL
jgi:hypothetical protein